MKSVWAVAMAVVLLGSGCAGRGVAAFEGKRAALVAGMDDFNLLLLGSGLDAHELPLADVSEPEAQRLLAELKLLSPTTRTYGPRRVAEVLLWEVFASGIPATRAEMNRRIKRYEGLAVLTPEGLLCWALTGEVVEWVGKVVVEGGTGKARGLTVGSLYGRRGASWWQVEWTEDWAERMAAMGVMPSR